MMRVGSCEMSSSWTSTGVGAISGAGAATAEGVYPLEAATAAVARLRPQTLQNLASSRFAVLHVGQIIPALLYDKYRDAPWRVLVIHNCFCKRFASTFFGSRCSASRIIRRASVLLLVFR